MEMTNLGAALKFTMELETQAMKIYDNLVQLTKDTELEGTFLAFSGSCKKRKSMMENLYNENVYSDQDSGIFEPLPGMNGADYLTTTDPTNELKNYPAILKLAIEMEEKSNRFYLDLAAQLKSRRRGVARNFEKMAQENYDRNLKLQSLYEPLENLHGMKRR